MKIALINVVMDGDYQYEEELPLGLASIGAFIREKGYDVKFHQCFASRGEEQIKIAGFVSADIYGFQLSVVNYLKVKQVVENIKKNNSNAVTVFGGPFLVTLSEDILKNEPLFDFMIIGEGEYTFLELLEKLENDVSKDYSYIDGLVWRNNSLNKIQKNNLRKPFDNLDQFPFPSRDFLENAKKDDVDNKIIESVRVITSRGCIGKCTFCCVNLYSKILKTKRWRGRSSKHVVDEIEILVNKYGVRLINFSDSSFEDPGEKGKQRSGEICEEILRRNLILSAKIYMRCETMRNKQDFDLLRLFKKAGIDIIIIGAEAANDYELGLYEKHASVEDSLRTINILKELDLFYFMVGFIMFGPNSTKETLITNLEFLHKNNLTDNLMQLANVLLLIKDSKLYFKLKDEGRVVESGKYWELPKYKFIDAISMKMAKHWSNLYCRFPISKEINSLQVNLGNIIYRMSNKMNDKVLEELKDEYIELKVKYCDINKKIGDINYEYFKESLWQIENDISEDKLEIMGKEFFEKVYEKFFFNYAKLFNNFIEKVKYRGFSLSGIVFKHFYSAVAVNGIERFGRN